MNIPEYYRHFQNPATETKESDKEVKEPEKPKEPQSKIADKTEPPVVKKQSELPDVKTKIFQGNGFFLKQLEEWIDKTIYTITGPVSDGIQHNIIINVDRNVPFDNVKDYAEWQIRTLTQELKGCTLLNKTNVKLSNGMDAIEAYYSWFPVPEIKIYQRQMFILEGTTAYKMTASFTKKTQHTIGPQVEKMMLSFDIPPKA